MINLRSQVFFCKSLERAYKTFSTRALRHLRPPLNSRKGSRTYSIIVATILRISSVVLYAFFGSFATLCHISPCLGSLSVHFAITSCCFSCRAQVSVFVWDGFEEMNRVMNGKEGLERARKRALSRYEDFRNLHQSHAVSKTSDTTPTCPLNRCPEK